MLKHPPHLFTLGLNHESAPLSVRERLAFPAESMGDALRELYGLHEVAEAAILSTCNRTEIVAVGGASGVVRGWLCAHHGVAEAEVAAHVYAYDERATVQHTLRVAAGLDSMVLGEPQILGQMKEAFRTAEQARTTGPVLSRLYQHAFRVAKKVRSETEIGAKSVSIAAAAARLTGEIFAGLQGKEVLVIGAGDTARLITEHMHRLGPPRITVANRSLPRAAELAARFDGAACGLDALPQQLAAADVVVASTGASRAVVTRAMVKAAFATRRRKAVLMIDLGVPRNIEPKVADDGDVYLYAIDDLRLVTQANLEQRELAAVEAELLIDEGTAEFMHWLGTRDSATVIRAMHDRAEDTAAQLLRKARQRLAKGDDPTVVMQRLTHSLTRQLLHPPSRALRRADEAERQVLLEQAVRLFGLSDDQ